MTTKRYGVLFGSALALASLVALAGCGSESGPPAESAGVGGQSGSGGSAGDPGEDAGDGGVDPTDGGATSCAPPSDPTKSSLCLVVQPETIVFEPGNPRGDGLGVLFVQLFSTADADLPDGGKEGAVSTVVTLPQQPTDGTVATIDLAAGAQTIRFDDLPPTVYAEALFVEDVALLGAPLQPGMWIGGYDLGKGIAPHMPLEPITLTAGTTTMATTSLQAIRLLTVDVTRTVKPVGNGQGQMSVILTKTPDIASAPPVFGIAQSLCINVSGTAPVPVYGMLIGTGPYYFAATLEDFTSGTLPSLTPGSLTSLAPVDGGLTIGASSMFSFAPDAYRVTLAASLDVAIPAPGIGPDPVACPAPDGGAP